MKNYLKQFIVFVTLCYSFTNIYGQQFKKMVRYSTVSEHYFSIPYKDHFKELNDFDYNKMIAQNNEIYSEIIIDNQNFPSITTKYLNGMRYENDYENEVSKSVTNRIETILYDAQDHIIISQPNEPDDPFSRALSNDQVDNFGDYTSMFRSSPYQTMQALILQNFRVQYIPSRLILIAVNNDVEITIDYRNYISEIRFFYQRNFNFSKTYQYQRFNGFIIPLLEINTVQDSLSNQTPFIKTEIIKYKEYSILNEKGVPILIFKNPELKIEKEIKIKPFEPISQRDIEMKVYPNPTQNIVTIEFPFYMEEEISVEISNCLGKIIFQKTIAQNEKIEADLTSFPDGIYFVKSVCDGITKSAKIIKQ